MALAAGTPFACFHHHLIYMCSPSMSRADRRIFNALTSTAAVLDFLEEKFAIAMAAGEEAL